MGMSAVANLIVSNPKMPHLYFNTKLPKKLNFCFKEANIRK